MARRDARRDGLGDRSYGRRLSGDRMGSALGGLPVDGDRPVPVPVSVVGIVRHHFDPRRLPPNVCRCVTIDCEARYPAEGNGRSGKEPEGRA